MIIDLSGNLANRAGQYLNGMQRLGTGGARSMQMLQRSVHAAGQGIDRLGNRYTAMLTGVAGIGAAKQVADLEERFVRLGIDADADEAAMQRLKNRIFEVAKAPDIRVDPGQITDAVKEIINMTGDLKFAEGNIRNIGLAIQATGAQGKDIGLILAEFQKMGIVDPKKTLEALDILTVQGKAGAFTLQNLAALGPRVVTAYTSMGRGGVTAIREMGAALQVIRMGTGSSEMAATAWEAVLRTLGNAKKVQMLQKGGIQVFDVEQLKRGKETLRPINELMVEIVKKTGGKKTLLSKVFEEEAIRAFNTAASEFQRTGSIESLEKFYKVQADGTVITQDSIRAARTANAAMTNLYTVWKQFADGNLTEPIKNLTEYLDGLKPGTVERWLKIAKYAALVGGGLILARKGVGLYEFGRDIVTGGKGKTGMAGGLGKGGPIPVYVVNKHLSMLPGQGWGFPGGEGAPGGTVGKVGKLAKYAKNAGLVGTAAAVGYGAGTLINEGIGWGMGKMSNRKYEGSGAIGEWLYDLIHKEGNVAIQKKAEVGGEIRIKVDSEGRAKVTGLSTKNDNVPLNIDSGLMGFGGG
jgi:hypothetical protein